MEAREFYDREDPARPGTLVDMDLLYPEGFCEALSGVSASTRASVS